MQEWFNIRCYSIGFVSKIKLSWVCVYEGSCKMPTYPSRMFKSTNAAYVSYLYDIQVNLSLNCKDSRIILNHGLMESTSETGLQVRSRDDNLLSDFVDSKSTVRNLCDSQGYQNMDFS